MKRVMVLGIDGGSFDLLLPLMKKGALPNLWKLCSEGARAPLLSTIPPVTPAAWATLMTGTNCGRHGIYYFFPWELSKYSLNPKGNFVSSAQIDGVPFWKIMNKAGKKTILVNLPLTYPPFPVDGCVVSGFPAPVKPKVFTHPKDLAGELGDYRIDLPKLIENEEWNLESFLKTEGPEKYLDSVLALQEKRTAACEMLLRDKAWDFFMAVFVGNDRLAHFFWPESDRDMNNPLIRYLEKLDSDFGRLLNHVDAETTVAVMSDHGFGPSPTCSINVLDVLRGSGHFKLRTFATPYYAARIMMRMARLIRDPVPPDAVHRIIDFKRSRVFPVPIYNNIFGIAVNTAGEKLSGCVEPGDEYEKVRDEVIDFVEHLKRPGTGEAVVESVRRREEIYKGPRLAEAPDLIVALKPEYTVHFGCNLRPAFRERPYFRPGEHRREGILILSGPGIKNGELPQSPDIADVTPTLLYSLGVPIPEHLDGSIVRDAFEPGYLDEHPPASTVWREEKTRKDEEGFDKEASKEIADQLRNLGYL